MLKQSMKLNIQQGAGLIEVLTSLLVLSVGILGVLALQSRSIQLNQGALYESKATILAADISDRIRANVEQASRYRINFDDDPPSGDCSGTSADCSPEQLADYDLSGWRANVAASLPEGRGQVEEVIGAGGRPVYIITIEYLDERPEASTAFGLSNDPTPKQFVFRTAI